MHEDIQWREEENIKELMHGGLEVRKILGCNPAVVFNRHPVVVCGHDREGRVVVYVTFFVCVCPHNNNNRTTESSKTDTNTWVKRRNSMRSCKSVPSIRF